MHTKQMIENEKQGRKSETFVPQSMREVRGEYKGVRSLAFPPLMKRDQQENMTLLFT